MQSQFISRTAGITTEAVVVIVISFIVIGNITTTDIIFHDFYVLPAIETCFPQNQDDFCKNIRMRHGLEQNSQIEIGNVYWQELLRQAITNGVILFAIRMGFAFMLQRLKIQRIRPVTVLVAFIWGLTATGLFLFGFLDFMYYWLRGYEIPETLTWLNNVGVFTETRTITGDPNVVESADLYATMLIGIGVFALVWLVAMYVYMQSGMKRGFA